MKKLQKENVRSVISCILSLLMTICIALLVVLSGLSITTFQTGSITGRMNAAYFKAAQDSIVETWKDDYAPSSGLPDTVFDNLISTSMIEQDTKAAVQSLLGGIDYSFDQTKVKQLLMDRFTQYAADNGVDISTTNLSSLADMCALEYRTQLDIPVLGDYAHIQIQFDHAFPYALIGISVLLIVLVLFLFYIHPFKHRAVRYSVYSLLASALVVLPVPLFYLIQGDYNDKITPAHIRLLFASMIQTTLAGLVLGGLLVGILGFALIPLANRMRDSLLKNSHHEHHSHHHQSYQSSQ